MNEKPDHLLRAELLIAMVLRYGVLLCLFVIGVGLLMRLSMGDGNAALIHTLLGGLAPAEYHPPTSLAAFTLSPDHVIAFGLVMLIALPILRVALTTLIFFFEKDWAFFAITLVVLTVLLSGIMLGRAL